jgi:large subunit ribosomal protein L19e
MEVKRQRNKAARQRKVERQEAKRNELAGEDEAEA